MDINANPPEQGMDGNMDQIADQSLATVLAFLAPHGDKSLIIEYGGRTIQPGYHVTEVKAGSFVTLDCGGNPDAWQETILQLEDIPPAPGQTHMMVDKFRAILAQVGQKVPLNHDARLTLEVGPPGVPMQVHDVGPLAIAGDAVILRLVPRPAICKPRHRAEFSAVQSCCAPATARAACCG